MNSAHKRVLFDTSTLIGVMLKPQSLPAQVFYHAAKYCLLIASAETMNELAEVVQREKFDRFRSRGERLTILAYYQSLAIIVPVTEEVTDCRDEKDNKFLSAALAGKVDVLVSSDEDLLVLNPYRGIPVIKARQYADQFGVLA
ncbi:MAG: putative toxin-antitoxin system toxin component, PIN family [Thiolinea sp.]